MKIDVSRNNSADNDSSTEKNGIGSTIVCMIGHNRTGKSSIAKKWATTYKRKNPKNEIWAFDPQRNFDGIANNFIFSHQNGWEKVFTKLSNCLLILDDFRMIMSKDRPPKEFLELLYMRAKVGVDILLICHNPKFVFNEASYFIDYYFIFFTMSRLGDFKDKIPSYVECQYAKDLINLYVKEYDVYSEKNKAKIYPNFPYVMVDARKLQISCVNMDKKNTDLIIRKLEPLETI